MEKAPKPHQTKILTTEKSLLECVRKCADEFAYIGAMNQHFAGKMTMLCKAITPDRAMDACLNAYWDLLDEVADKIQRGEWK